MHNRLPFATTLPTTSPNTFPFTTSPTRSPWGPPCRRAAGGEEEKWQEVHGSGRVLGLDTFVATSSVRGVGHA